MTVCLDFDDFLRYKYDNYKQNDNQKLELELETIEQKKIRWVNQWAMMPFTRAIDKLVITIKDSNSKTAQSLRSIYEKNKDHMRWVS